MSRKPSLVKGDALRKYIVANVYFINVPSVVVQEWMGFQATTL
jgi:hypothetical protein